MNTLNCDLKAGVHSGKPARSKEQLKKKVISHMRMLQRKSARVKKYFKHEMIRICGVVDLLNGRVNSICRTLKGLTVESFIRHGRHVH